jgi:predicted regulator of Ras-like GTPase activity (Roadblock/LC7/MglB family)
MAKLDQLMREVQNELGTDFLYMDIVGSDGLIIAELRLSDRDTTAVTARYSMIAKLASKVAEKLNLGDIEDNLITVGKSYVMMRLLGDGSYFVVLSVTRKASLGVVRMLLKDYAGQLWDAIPR